MRLHSSPTRLGAKREKQMTVKMLSAILSSDNEQIRAIGIVTKNIAKKP
jgi:hypothetical protein